MLLECVTPETASSYSWIKLSNKSFGEEVAAVVAEKLSAMVNLQVADLSDIIAGRETSIGLSVLQQ